MLLLLHFDNRHDIRQLEIYGVITAKNKTTLYLTFNISPQINKIQHVAALLYVVCDGVEGAGVQLKIKLQLCILVPFTNSCFVIVKTILLFTPVLLS